MMKADASNSSSPPIKGALFATAEAAQKIYGRYPNVIGVGVGTKFSNGRPAGDLLTIHFYVRKKLSRISKPKTLPRFVYLRKRNGSVDYSKKVATDVIELKHLKFACKSGTEIGVIGETGTLTLLFRNKSLRQEEYYLITCAHVAGDVRQSPPVDPTIEGSCCKRPRVFAITIANSTQTNGSVDYDIALARITSECSPQPDLQVLGTSITLRRFLSSDSIRPGLSLDCAFARSNTVSATVSSFRTSLPLNLDGRLYQVHNLFLINRPPKPGDSRGLLYDGPTAGIRVYPTRVCLSVDDGEKKTTLAYLPDYSRAYDIKPLTIFAKQDFKLEIEEGQVKALTANQDTTAFLTFLKEAANLAAKAAGVGVSSTVMNGSFGLKSGIYCLTDSGRFQ